jgi:hypothetical protein
MNEDLEYNLGQGSGVLGDTKNFDPDVSNEPILRIILKELAELKAAYHTIDKLSLDDKNFTIEQQLQNNQWATQLIGNIELKINEKLKELDNGR